MLIKVFIFEDHWMCREALVAVLGKAGNIQIVGAVEEVGEGFQRAVKLKPDVVLMDVLFHGVKLGIQATAAIKKALPETKVLVFTEFPDEDTLRNAVKAGASGFLLKKEVQDPDVIVNAIRTVHRGHAYLTPLMTEKILNVVRHAAEKDGYELTKRELEILQLINKGKNNKAIATELGIDIRTVANHVSNLLFKMDANNRTEAAAIARREGILE
ncbi:MAG: response regulator transcription factor [Proteobacteria bacterium]|nr:response regulator transcription factor [Pseudomonadota bacterium]